MKKTIVLMVIKGGNASPYWVPCVVLKGVAEDLCKNKPTEYRMPE